MSNPHPSPGSRPLEQLKVAELRDELRKRGLSLKGVKKDLFERLDEAVRKEHAGTLPSAPEVVEEVVQLEGEHAIAHSAGHPHHYNASETVQDGDGLLYLNDGENPLQDSALIVNNVSPYVGASDATPVFMEPRKDIEKLNTGFEDDVPIINNINSSSGGALPEVDTGDVSKPDNLMLENLSGVDNQAVENVAVIPEPDKQASGNETILSGKEAKDVILPEDSYQGSGNDVVLPEFVSQAGGKDGLSAVPEVSNMNSTVLVVPIDDALSTHSGAASREDAGVVEIVTLVQESGGAEVTTQGAQGEVAIPSEAVKDIAITSVSDDLLSVADASLQTSNCVVIANDSPVQDAEVIEKTVLTSVNVVPCVQESVEDGSDGGLKSETSKVLKDNLLVEEAKWELLEGGEAPIPTSADREAPEAPPADAILEAAQDLILPEVQQDITMPESQQDSVIHEVVQDLVVQEVLQDTDMLEPLESPFMKMEVSEMVSETKQSAVTMDAPDPPVDIKSENIRNVHAADSNKPNVAMMLDEGNLNVKLEPMEAESRAGRRMVPVENVKVEHQDIKEDLAKSGRFSDRSRSKGSEYERSRHEPVRASTYGDERSRGEGRSSRVFREERRKDPKERDLKPKEEEFHDHSSQKRKDDDRDANQQEPAKRMRRWNSGNQLVVETAKPLTTGIVKEITSPEIKKEGFAVAPPKLTPKLSGPSKPIPVTAKTNSEANGVKRAVPPSTRDPSSSLKVERFVRPFPLKAVKDLLSEFGQCVDFWMDQIKTHCYVTYSKVDEAVAARNGLYDKQWPPSFGNLLVADFVDAKEVKMRSDGSFEKINAPQATTPRGIPIQPLAQGAPFHGHANSLASAPPLRERQLMQVPMKDPEPPVPTLDDLFRKTKTKPHIYYLPLTDEQVAEKLAAVKNKEQQQARSKPSGRV